MKNETLKNYLEDLISDILSEKKNSRYLACKVRVLINNLPKKEIKQVLKPITNKIPINLINDKISEEKDYFI